MYILKCIFSKFLSHLLFSLKLDTWEWCIDPWIRLSYLGKQLCLECQDNQVKEGKAWILKKTMFDWQKQFWRDVRAKGKWGGEPWFTLKGLLYNLNIVNVGFASPPAVLPRWNSLERVFNTYSHWRPLGLMLMGADVCLLLRVPIATQHTNRGSWCHGRTVLPRELKEGQRQLFLPPESSSAFPPSPALLASRAMTGAMEPKANSVWDVLGSEGQPGSARGRWDAPM